MNTFLNENNYTFKLNSENNIPIDDDYKSFECYSKYFNIKIKQYIHYTDVYLIHV